MSDDVFPTISASVHDDAITRVGLITLNIHGHLDAKGCAYQARVENTSTGVRWHIQGQLAEAIGKLIQMSEGETEHA